MKLSKRDRLKSPITKLSTVIVSCGLGAFLVGCSDDGKCNDKGIQYAPQSVIDDCKKSGGSGGYGSSSRSSSTTILPTSTGYFGSTSSAYHSSGG